MVVAHFGHGAVAAVMSGIAIAATGVLFIAALPTPKAALPSLTTRARAMLKAADLTTERGYCGGEPVEMKIERRYHED
jgi:hypothetical protein